MKQKSAMAQGLEFLMKDPKTNPLHPDGKRVFNEIMNQSGMSVSESMKYIGKKSKKPRVSDDDRSKQRLEKLEQE